MATEEGGGVESLLSLAKSCVNEGAKLNNMLYDLVATPDCEKVQDKPQHPNLLLELREYLIDCRQQIKQAQDTLERDVIQQIGKK